MSELPYSTNPRTDNSLFGGASRFGRKKRSICILLVLTVFFVLWFNSDLDRLHGTTDVDTNKQSQKDINNTPFIEEKDDTTDLETETEDKDDFSVEDKEESPVEDVKEDTKTNIKYTPPTTIYKNTPQHFRYFMVIASRATNLSRRQLIRKTYFGLDDNIEPCMKREKALNYLFWVYGDVPQSNTAERRLYETEKMEYNDLEKVNKASYSQDDILRWAETTLKDRGITYDYLIIQDGYSLIQLSYAQQTVQAEVGQFPIERVPTDLAWVSTKHKNAVVVGSTAVKKLMENESQFQDFIPGSTLLEGYYEFYRSISTQLHHVTSKKEVDRIKALVKDAPFFISEINRFATWENNVEAIPSMTIAVANIYQDDDFASIGKALNVGPASLCKILEKPSIAVVTSSYIYDACMEPSAALAADNKRQYALAHNYAFVARSGEFAQQSLRTEKRRPVWGKIDVVQKVLPKYDWIFWLDMDAVILNPDQTVQTLLDQFRNSFTDGPRGFESTIDLVIAKPTRDKMINAGVFFMRNTPWAQKFLNAVQESKEWYNKGPSYEQGAMWDLIQQSGFKEHVLLLENDDHTFNTLPKRYIPGDFIVHFAPDKCPNDAVLEGLKAARKIQKGEMVTSFSDA